MLFFALVVVVSVILYVLLKPARWSQEIVNYLNQNILQENGWSISIESLEGRFTSDVYLRNLYLRKEDGTAAVFTEKAKVNLDFSRILAGDWAISHLSLRDGFITVKSGQEAAKREFEFVDRLASRGFSIRELNLTNTALIVGSGSRENLYSLDLGGKLESRGKTLTFFPEKVRVTDVGNRRDFQLDAGEFVLSTHDLRVKGMEGQVSGVPVELDGSVTFSTPMKWVVNGTGRGLIVSDYLDRAVAEVLEVDTVDIRFRVGTDLSSATIAGSLFSPGSENLVGEITADLVRDSQLVVLNDALVSVKSAQIMGSGTLGSGRDLFLQMGIKGLDLAEFGLAGNSTAISGSVDVSGSIDGRKVEEMTFILDLVNGEPGHEAYVRTTGQLVYANDTVKIADSLRLDLEYGSLLATGEIDLKKERLDLSFTPFNINLESVGYLVGGYSLTGVAGGAVDVVGYLRDPVASGYLRIKNGGFSRFSMSSLEASFRINSVLHNPHGSLRAGFSDGRIGDYAVEKGTADLYFRGDTILVEQLRLTRGKDFLQASGTMVAGRSFRVNQVQLSLGDHYVTSLGPVAVRTRPGVLEVEPATFRVNEGRAEVSLAMLNGRLSSGVFRLTNLSLASLWKLLNRDVSLTGAAFADVSATTEGNRLKATGMFEVRDGTWKSIKFDKLLITASVDENVVNVREFRVTGPGGMNLEVSGFAGVKPGGTPGLYEIDPVREMGFSSEFRNFRLELLTVLWPGARLIGGSATGSLIVTGLANSPEMVFESTIKNPKLGLISGKAISGSGRYTDRRLYLEDMVAETETGQFSGNGYVPVNLAMGTQSSERILKRDPISMTFHGESSRLSYLTPYLTSIDSVEGEISFDLTISGTPAAPVRNGRINVRNGTIYAFLLDSPIRNVNGNAVIENNHLIIDDLTASSDVPPKMDLTTQLKSNLSSLSKGALFGQGQKKPSPNIRVTGSMDLTEFFKPDLAFLVTGKNVYIRTLLGEIEGVTNLKLSVTGKDTLNIVGDIVPRQAVLRLEFSEAGEYQEVEPAGPGLTRYLVRFPISGNVLLRNSQIDAELSGDIVIQKSGNSPSRYSGELNLLSGKFYYYSDVFEIQEGHLIFDPTEFNPKMDIYATTTISGIDIDVTLSGTFDEPVMLIADSEQNYSQSDLLQLLTIQKRFNQQDLTTKGLGDQSVYLFGRFLKSEVERSLVRSTPLLDEFEIQGSASLLESSGDRDLALKVGTRPSPNLYLSYKQSFSLAEPSQVGVEYRLNPNVSLVVTYDDDGEMHLRYRRKYKF